VLRLRYLIDFLVYLGTKYLAFTLLPLDGESAFLLAIVVAGVAVVAFDRVAWRRDRQPRNSTA
jgi:hypothetical protein